MPVRRRRRRRPHRNPGLGRGDARHRGVRAARRTLRLIDEGGPFPHERDGSVFGAFEGLLPRHENGYCRECTVPTPGPDDRGARRVVTGRNGETHRTDAPYASFTAVPR
ncbi:ribonuclease domain-containing protein [Streptomyces griseoincarnatus]|uniref:ribonuclease domain-containing protein n=1 Tax=Streptomyces variabilis TaxID=67372 RepID=UPI0027E3D0DA|nr:ribonuclease domain-containing protein [Streptomyces variabilis]